MGQTESPSQSVGPAIENIYAPKSLNDCIVRDYWKLKPKSPDYSAD